MIIFPYPGQSQRMYFSDLPYENHTLIYERLKQATEKRTKSSKKKNHVYRHIKSYKNIKQIHGSVSIYE